INKRPSVLILNVRRVSIIDATGEANLRALVNDFQKMKGTVLISRANSDTLTMLKKSGLSDVIGAEHFFPTTQAAMDYSMTLIETDQCSHCSQNGFKTCRLVA